MNNKISFVCTEGICYKQVTSLCVSLCENEQRMKPICKELVVQKAWQTHFNWRTMFNYDVRQHVS